MDITGLIAVIGAFGIGPMIVYLRGRHKIEERRLELEARTGGGGPEQVRGKPVDARSDIYALGALAYHLVCGRPPFAGDNPIAIGFAHVSEPVMPPRQLRKDVSAALDAAIVAALAKAPEDRPQSARAFVDQAFAAA